jgi:hypothetical protein
VVLMARMPPKNRVRGCLAVYLAKSNIVSCGELWRSWLWLFGKQS